MPYAKRRITNEDILLTEGPAVNLRMAIEDILKVRSTRRGGEMYSSDTIYSNVWRQFRDLIDLETVKCPSSQFDQ